VAIEVSAHAVAELLRQPPNDGFHDTRTRALPLDVADRGSRLLVAVSTSTLQGSEHGQASPSSQSVAAIRVTAPRAARSPESSSIATMLRHAKQMPVASRVEVQACCEFRRVHAAH
jgi:hypothetical protein